VAGAGRRTPAPHGGRKPGWLTLKAPAPRQYRATGALLDELGLHTVCEEARCPNKGECFGAGTATFLILGDACTRACRFCSVAGATAGGPALRALDAGEPGRVAEAAARLGLRHVVVTSVTRDDLPDGGASHFAATVHAVRRALPGATVEVLIPDLGGDAAALRAVLAARPDVLGHNLETAPRLYPRARPQAGYARSLELLGRAAAWARGATAVARDGARAHASARPADGSGPPAARPLVKTGLMVGLGETADEVEQVLEDAAASGVDLVTIGQYLQPRRDRLPVARYVEPAEFSAWERRGAELGLSVAAAPFVRSSYRAGDALCGPDAVAGEEPGA
jgi:lipoyl synthase